MKALHSVVETIQAQADYQDGLNCLIGFLLTRIEVSGRERLLEALSDEIQALCETAAHSPVLWPFLQLEAQLQAAVAAPVASPGLPSELHRRFPRLPGAPAVTALSVVSGTAEQRNK